MGSLPPETCRRAAALLREARSTLESIASLPGELAPRSLEEGYAIQEAFLAAAAGRIAGFKIGATSQRAQDYLKLDGPFHGCLFADAIHHSPAQLSAGRFPFRLIEPEFAFCLGADLPARAAPYERHEVSAAVASLHPAFEVVTSAFGEAWTGVGAAALIADNGVHGALVLGSGCEDWQDFDLASHPVRFERNGREEGDGVGANALGHPLTALAWLADQGARGGRGLKAGDIVSTGVVTPFIYAEAGDEVSADFGELGAVDIRFIP